jgi:glyoxylase-like metal-dependent hydrolase (beta-lactamase superfamily II)
MVNKLLHLICVLAVAALLFGKGIDAPQQNNGPPQYQIYAIRYATIPDLPTAMFVQDAAPERKTAAAMAIWLIRGNDRNVLLDSGFYHERFFKDWNVKDFVKPSEPLAALGLKPEDITDIIVSHMHWDHADGLDLFPKAQIWIQRDEYAYYTGEAWHGNTHGGIDPEDVLTLVKLNTDGRVSFVNGDDQEIIPGITCYTGGKHTFQSQFVGVNSRDGKVVLASDNLYFYENLEKHVPIGTTLDAASNLRAQDRMRQIAASPELIVPGHEPAVFERFPKLSDRVVQIQRTHPHP